MINATAVMMMKGITYATRHATCGVRCWYRTRELKTAGITKYVIPPPELPSPPERALALPTISLSKNPVLHT